MSENRKRNRMVSIRLSEEEYANLEEKAKYLGRTVPAFLRELALAKKVRQPLVDREGALEIAKQIRAIGNNLNQLSKHANQGTKVIDLTNVREELSQVWQLLSSRIQK